VNSMRRAVRRGVHQGFNLEKGRELGVETSIVEVRTVRAEENQRWSCLGEGEFRGGGSANCQV